MPVTPGQSISYASGAAGSGGAYGDESSSGTSGTDSSFGTLSSASGAANPTGYLDTTTGLRFAASGADGVAGGSGSGAERASDGRWVYTDGTPVSAGGQSWQPGANDAEIRTISDSSTQGNFTSAARGSFGGGAAYGANGSAGQPATEADLEILYAEYAQIRYAYYSKAKGSAGGAGASAIAPSAASAYGAGGQGGHGGGGAGAGGAAESTVRYLSDAETHGGVSSLPAPNAQPGAGTAGGAGGAGCILLFYSTPKPDTSGWLRDSDLAPMLDKYGRKVIV